MHIRHLVAVALSCVLFACQRSTPPSAPASADTTALPASADFAPVLAPDAESPQSVQSDAVVPSNDDTNTQVPPLSDEERARQAELEWVGEDEDRKALLANAKPLVGDDCSLHWETELGLFRLGRKQVLNGNMEVDREGGQPVFFVGDSFGEGLGAHTRVFNLPRADGTLLVGIGHGLAHHDYSDAAAGSSHILWRLDCKAPRQPPTRFHVEGGADFGHSVVTPDGESLIFWSQQGVSRLSLVDKRIEHLIDRPPLDPKWADIFEEDVGVSRRLIIPESLVAGGLSVLVGTPPVGSHGSFDLAPWIVDYEDPLKRNNPHTWEGHVGIASVVEGRDGVVWLGDAGPCALANSPSSAGSVWRSKDRGLTFESVALERAKDNDRWPTAVSEIIVDPRDGKRLLVRTAVCQANLSDPFGGQVYQTRDGGRTWSRLELDTLLGDDSGGSVDRLWSVDGTLDHLRMARHKSDEDVSSPQSWIVWESRDKGLTWVSVEGGVVPPAIRNGEKIVLSARAKSPAVSLEVWPSGLFRIVEGSDAERVFPPRHFIPKLVLRGRPLEPESPRKAVSWEDIDRSAEANRRGLDLSKTKQFDAAVEAFAEAYKINPNNFLARYNAACAHALANRPKEAMALLESLSRTGGHAALSALAVASKDNDLKGLRKLPRFAVLTAVAAPGSAYMGEPIEVIESGFPMALSDPHERLCLGNFRFEEAAEGVDEAPGVYDRFDCQTGVVKGQLRGSIVDIDRRLNDLGMLLWIKVEPEDTTHAALVGWAKARLALDVLDTESTMLFRSPSGRLAMVTTSVEGADGESTTRSAFGSAPAP